MIGLNFSGLGQFGFAIIFLGSGKVGKKTSGRVFGFSGFRAFGYSTHRCTYNVDIR